MDNMSGMDIGDDEHADDTMDDMAGMETTDEHDEGAMDDMEMAGEHDEAEHTDEAMPAGEFGPFKMPLMDAHEGLMVMIDPPAMALGGEPTIIEFTVPEDKVGTWTFACFQERGQHYDDGMEGTLIVEP